MVRYADAPNRLVAYVLDVVILAALIFVGSVVVALVLGPAIHVDADVRLQVDERLVTINGMLATLLNAAYFVLSWTRRRATPGQRLVGLWTGSAHDGSPLPAGRALLRWALLGGPFVAASVLALWLPAVAGPLMMLGLGWYAVVLMTIARDPRRRGVHDRCAGSVVVKASLPPTWTVEGMDAG